MKGLISALVLSCCVAMFGFAQDANTGKKPEMKTEKKEMTKGDNKWHGYVVDAMCAKTILKKDNIMERAAKHTKDCALEDACSATGYGLFYDNKYYKFDEAGDKMAKAAIEKSKKDKDLMFDVTGKMEGDKIMVASLSEMKMDKMDMGKKADDSKKGMKKMEKKDAPKD